MISYFQGQSGEKGTVPDDDFKLNITYLPIRGRKSSMIYLQGQSPFGHIIKRLIHKKSS